MRLTKRNPETGLYEYHEKAKTQAEFNEQRKAVIQKLGEYEDKYEKYSEIIKLYKYCEKTGVECQLEKLFDGYAIRFNNGGDVIQHHGSYGCDFGCVEPAIGSRLDYTAVPLKKAMALVRRYKDKLNKVKEGETDEQKQADRYFREYCFG